MTRVTFLATAAGLVIGVVAGASVTEQAQQPQPYSVGNRLGLPVTPVADGAFEPISSNVKVYGAIYSAESCSYDAGRGVIVVPNRGVPQNVQANNAWVSFVNHDGSVHTARWIGVQNPPERAKVQRIQNVVHPANRQLLALDDRQSLRFAPILGCSKRADLQCEIGE